MPRADPAAVLMSTLLDRAIDVVSGCVKLPAVAECPDPREHEAMSFDDDSLLLRVECKRSGLCLLPFLRCPCPFNRHVMKRALPGIVEKPVL